jgi:hypothetical protein
MEYLFDKNDKEISKILSSTNSNDLINYVFALNKHDQEKIYKIIEKIVDENY